jgi:uncharacterized membrane protein (UPF0127 family)
MFKRFPLLCLLAMALLSPALNSAMAAPMTVIKQDGREVTLDVSVADTAEKQSKGLMFVQAMPPKSGMVFPMQPPRQARFWMRNTLIALDMIFILPGGLIGQIVTRSDTQSDKTTASLQKVSAVLELNAGAAQKLGIAVGDIVRMDEVDF